MYFLFLLCASAAYASFFEHTLHRFLMHRPFFGFTYAYQAHAKIHHHVFGFDETYHCKRREDARIISMAWWNGPVLILVTAILPALAAWYFGDWTIVIVQCIVAALYYAVYEYIHWCMHLPKAKRRLIERFNVFGCRIFYRLNGHHLLHHRYMGKNFNVVLPFADLCLGTLVLRSKFAFSQPRGIDVPDVQPRRK
ncbi:MAG: hypothetical protein G01um101472_152 [Parcubacteria group bacterium Gr01-1014_72]|nr:MAG: hypothetical protein G01um101472_152 [Parcubacteria group bacterium Gr01-1014_72]